MSALLAISIDLSKLDKSKFIEGKNGSKYVNLTVGVNSETNQYGQNASVSLAQSKEERDAGSKKTYVGNGKVIWTDGAIAVAERAPVGDEQKSDGLPF